jgi:CRP-like cAMP-binding protein
LTLAPVSILQNHQFVRGLDRKQLESLAAHADQVEFKENEIVLVDGQHSSSFYLLVTGSVAIELRASRYAVCVEALGPGQVFGWSALLDHQDTLFQVRAREHTVALRIDGSTLQRLCREDPRLGTEILRRTLQVVAGRVKATELRFAEMCGVKV